MSGLIYAVIVAVWLAVLIPIWLRRHDDAAVTRSADRYSRAMRTLSRRPAQVGSREIVLPPRPQVAMASAAGPGVAVTSALGGPRAVPRHEVSAPTRGVGPARTRPDRRTRAASASLARRRARTLLVLLALTIVVLALGLTGVLPLWAAALPALLLVAFVVHLRLQARRAAHRRRGPVAPPVAQQTVQPRSESSAVRRRGARAGAAPVEGDSGASRSRAVVVESKNAGTLGGPTASGAVGEAPAASAPVVAEHAMADVEADLDDDEAWRPQSWPLPTYVTKPKAVRPVRVIDLTTPGAWTSGRLLDDEVESVEEVMAAAEETTLELDAIVERAVND